MASFNQLKEGDYTIFGFKAKFLKFCNNPVGFLVWYCVLALTTGIMSSGVANINVGTLERRFGFESGQSAIILIGYDISFGLFAAVITYFGGHRNRPRIVALGAAIYGLGALIYALPHFITPNFILGNDVTVYCLPGASQKCNQGNGNNSRYMGALLVGQLLMGLGNTPLFTLGLAYIEDSVAKHVSGAYLGIANAASLIGPMIGFSVGGIFLRDVYVDFDSVPSPEFNIFKWVGAWWLFPIICMGLSWISVLPLSGFPKHLPGTQRNREKRKSEVHLSSSDVEKTLHNDRLELKDLPKAFKTLFKNPTYVFLLLGGSSLAVLVNGVSGFMAKFLQQAYHISSGQSAIYAGLVLVPAAVIGHLISGFLIFKLKWKVPAMLKCCFISLIIVGLLSPGFLLRCDSAKVAGLNVPYGDGSFFPGENVTGVCAPSVCNCQEEYYVPICGNDGINYFSPCHAGCIPVLNNTAVPPVPTGEITCSCVNNTYTFENAQELFGKPCPANCNTLKAALAIAFFMTFFSFFVQTPAIAATFRIVPDELRSFAIGFQWTFIRIVGTIPGPLIYGAFIDSTCTFWQKRQCDGSRGFCWLYDNGQMAINFMISSLVFNLLGAFLYFLALWFYKPIPTGENYNKNGKKPKTISGDVNPTYEDKF